MNRFWNWKKGEQGRELRLDGVIASESWYEDEISPKEFKNELYAEDGPVTVWINSPGGDCFAASRIYTMLREYPGEATGKIDGLAGSAATVLAMGCDKLLMAPTASFFIHNPSSSVWSGEEKDMDRASAMLREVKESIINAYEQKTGLSRVRLARMMDESTMMNARKALELGFIDGILYAEGEARGENSEDEPEGMAYNMLPPANILRHADRLTPVGRVSSVELYDRLYSI